MKEILTNTTNGATNHPYGNLVAVIYQILAHLFPVVKAAKGNKPDPRLAQLEAILQEIQTLAAALDELDAQQATAPTPAHPQAAHPHITSLSAAHPSAAARAQSAQPNHCPALARLQTWNTKPEHHLLN